VRYENTTPALPEDILDNYLKFLYFLLYSVNRLQGVILAKLFRVGKHITDAILTLMKYVRDTTGTVPSQEEIANALKSYFILNELGNQIKFQRKKPIAPDRPETFSKGPFWRLNLVAGSPKNSFIRAGLFYESVQTAIKTAQNFVKKSSGDEPSEEEIASSLKSSFILSEIKNQIDWQRQGSQKTKKSESNPG